MPSDPVPPPAGEKALEPAKAAGPRVLVESLRTDPALAALCLAAPWQRLAGIAIDVVLIGALSILAGPVLGLCTGVTLLALGDRRVSDTRAWAVIRWGFLALGGLVLALSLFLMAGRPLVRTGAFNLDAKLGEPVVLQPVELAPGATTPELRRAVNTLQGNVDRLAAENRRLREAARGSSWVNAVADLSRTAGLSFGWSGVYFTLLTAWLGGRTPGKWIAGTRVVRLDHRRLTAMDAFVRHGGYAAGLATGLIGFLRLLWDPNRQAIQDKIGWTVVVRSR